ncbi:MAG: fasciclin domain-containing protein, partial [Pseudomonadota bacterium]
MNALKTLAAAAALTFAGATAANAANIVEIAAGDDRFETLVAAVTAADLAEALSGPGPFTVFAPT